MADGLLDRIRGAVLKRRTAYRSLFRPQGGISIAGTVVLADLARFCRATTSTTMVSPVTRNVDPYASAVAEGRREVWNRIAGMIHVSDEDLYRLVGRDEDQE